VNSKSDAVHYFWVTKLADASLMRADWLSSPPEEANTFSRSTGCTRAPSSSKATCPETSLMRSRGSSSLSTMCSAVWTLSNKEKLKANVEGDRRHGTHFPGHGELNVASDLAVTLAGLAVHFSFAVAFGAVLQIATNSVNDPFFSGSKLERDTFLVAVAVLAVLAVEAPFLVAALVGHEAVAVAVQAPAPTFSVALATDDASRSSAPVAGLGALGPRHLDESDLVLEGLTGLLFDFPGQRRRQAASKGRGSVNGAVVPVSGDISNGQMAFTPRSFWGFWKIT
jgi:hypothetical protein